jgi:hypothetical protein
VLDLLRQTLAWCFRPAWWLFLRLVPVKDPWERLEIRLPATRYGTGSRHEFGWYLEGESAVAVASLHELQDWLLGCAYVGDPDLFHEADYWQHPGTFEQIRRGDCEDHAIWTWRKLLEMGVDADLVAGRRLPWDPRAECDQRGHMWIVFRTGGESFLLETVEKRRDRMIRPLRDVAASYRPELGVDRTRTRFTFNGYLLTARERRFGARPVAAAPSLTRPAAPPPPRS